MHALVLCACLSAIFVINFSTPGLLDRASQIKGTDFSNFYVLGSLTLAGRFEWLYDAEALHRLAIVLLPESSGTTYLPIYGPQVALFFAPLAMVSYAWALTVWLILTAALYALCCWLMWRECPHLHREGSTVIIVAAASPAFFNLLAHGQNSAIALVCFTGAFFALKHDRSFLAGLAIGMLIFKPQLGIVAACVFVVNREWRVIAGAIVGATVQLGLAWLYFGTDVMNAYWRWLSGIGDIAPLLHIKPYQMHSLLSFWRLLSPWNELAITLYAVCAAVVIAATCWCWRSSASLSLRYASLLLATVLVSPHLYVYDLVILAPALLLCADWAVGNPAAPLSKPVQQLVYFSYVLPLFSAATQFTRVQPSVLAMAGLLAMVTLVVMRGPDAQGWFSMLVGARSDRSARLRRPPEELQPPHRPHSAHPDT